MCDELKQADMLRMGAAKQLHKTAKELADLEDGFFWKWGCVLDRNDQEYRGYFNEWQDIRGDTVLTECCLIDVEMDECVSKGYSIRGVGDRPNGFQGRRVSFRRAAKALVEERTYGEFHKKARTAYTVLISWKGILMVTDEGLPRFDDLRHGIYFAD